MIHIDEPELSGPRRDRIVAARELLDIDGWVLTTSAAVRAVSGCWSDRVDLSGEFARGMVAVDDVVLDETYPANDPRLIDAIVDHLPRRGRIAVDRLGFAALARLQECRPDVTVVDASALLGAAQSPKSPAEMAVLEDGHHRTEAALLELLPAVVAGVTERELNQEFAALAASHGLDHLHVDTVFSVLPKDPDSVDWHRGEWEDAYPYRELTGERVLERGDHVAFDAGFLYRGYMTDVGWTLLVDDEPDEAQLRLADAWRDTALAVIETLQPGENAAAGRVAAMRSRRLDEPAPWPKGLYVAHGVGLCGVEAPLIGADFPPEIEEAMQIVPGQVFLVEPYAFESGVGGFRSEYAVAIEESGPRILNTVDVGYWAQDPRSRVSLA